MHLTSYSCSSFNLTQTSTVTNLSFVIVMKFGKRLRELVQESDEEWRPNFMDYKVLKKHIHPPSHMINNNTTSRDSDSHECDEEEEHEHEMEEISAEEKPAVIVKHNPTEHDELVMVNKQAVKQAEHLHSDFFQIFRREVDKVNEFFLEKQEDFIIEHRQLSSRVQLLLQPGHATRREINYIRSRLTHFHGELVVLEKFSTVNYTGFRKILKKHDKKTGLNIQYVYLDTVLVTPFFLSDTVRRLILSTENQFSKLDDIVKFQKPSPSPSVTGAGGSPATTNNVNHAQQLQRNKPVSKSDLSIEHHRQQQSSIYEQINQQRERQRTLAEAIQRQSAIDLPIPLATNSSTSPPRPHAFIAPRSSLWRLHQHARKFAESTRSEKIKNPPPRLLSLVDEVKPEELGITSDFLQKVTSPSLYIIVDGPHLSIGFVTLPSRTTLQAFPDKNRRILILRNLKGRASLRMFQRINSTENSDQEFKLEYVRGAVTIGPWPAIFAKCDAPVEWGSGHHEGVALFFVAVPPVDGTAFPAFCVSSGCDTSTSNDFRGFRGFKAHRDPDKDVDLVKVDC